MKTLVVPDVHVPFQCKEAERMLHKLIKEHKPEKIVFLGDVADIHALTTHPKITHWRDRLEDELLEKLHLKFALYVSTILNSLMLDDTLYRHRLLFQEPIGLQISSYFPGF